jgi:hypothetical protein
MKGEIAEGVEISGLIGEVDGKQHLNSCAHEVMAWANMYRRTRNDDYLTKAMQMIQYVNSNLTGGTNGGLRSGEIAPEEDGQCLPHLVQWIFALNCVLETLVVEKGGERKESINAVEIMKQGIDIAAVLRKYFLKNAKVRKLVWKWNVDLTSVLVDDARQIDAVEAYTALLQLDQRARQISADSKEELFVLLQAIEDFESSVSISDSLVTSDYTSLGRIMNCVAVLGSVFSTQQRISPFKASLLESLVKNVEKSFKLLSSEMMLNPVRSASLANYRSPAKELLLVFGLRSLMKVSESLDRYEFLSSRTIGRFRKMFNSIRDSASELTDEMLEFWSTDVYQESQSWIGERRSLQILLLRVHCL